MIKGRFAQAIAGLTALALAATIVLLIAVWASDEVDRLIVTAATVAAGALVSAAFLVAWRGYRATQRSLATARSTAASMKQVTRKLDVLDERVAELDHRLGVIDGRVVRANTRMQRSNRQNRKLETRVRKSFDRLDPVTPEALNRQLDKRMLELVNLLRAFGVTVQAEFESSVSEVADEVRRFGADTATRIDEQTKEVAAHAAETRRIVKVEAGEQETHLDVRTAELYGQVEALFAVYSSLNPRYPEAGLLGLATSAALPSYLIRIIDSRRPAHVVEVGSGLATVLMGLVLAESNGRLTVIEHDPDAAEAAAEMVQRYGLGQVVQVAQAPLIAIAGGDDTWRWYDIAALDLTTPIDLVVVGGPPADIGRHARYPALPLLREHLADDASIVLTDAAAGDTAETIDRWLHEYADLRLIRLDPQHGTAELRRQR